MLSKSSYCFVKVCENFWAPNPPFNCWILDFLVLYWFVVSNGLKTYKFKNIFVDFSFFNEIWLTTLCSGTSSDLTFVRTGNLLLTLKALCFFCWINNFFWTGAGFDGYVNHFFCLFFFILLTQIPVHFQTRVNGLFRHLCSHRTLDCKNYQIQSLIEVFGGFSPWSMK